MSGLRGTTRKSRGSRLYCHDTSYASPFNR